MALPLVQSQIDVLSLWQWGVRIDRATAALPQTTNAPIFTIAGGRVFVRMLVGEVTTIIQAQANNTKLTAVPTVGTSLDVCAVVDITALEVGGKLVPTGTLATALGKTVAGAALLMATPLVVAVGTLNLNCAASSTGNVKWSIWYSPLDDGAVVTAV